MDTLGVALAAGLAFLVAYFTYGRWLGQKIFRLSVKAVCPSTEFRDNVDYVPTPKGVVFGHHFTSIAGTGPIVGPAIAMFWGWLPALLWVVFGSIFIGAVHDLGALVVSLRNRGMTVGEVAGKVLNRRIRILFLLVLFMALTIVLAIFGLVVATVFKQFPATIFPCIVQVPLALIVGYWLKRKGIGLFWPSMVALGLMYISVIYGNVGLLGGINQSLADLPLWAWVSILLVYSLIASVLPVSVLLQPRDYINSLQLTTTMALVLLGLVLAAFIGGSPQGEDTARPTLELVAPMVQWNPEGAPLIFPFLFITIACGAISGFHCLVSSGTSSKQLKVETDARFIGYGSMLLEGFLATLVILACAAGLGLGVDFEGITLVGAEAWHHFYQSWSQSQGLPSLVAAFVKGSSNFLLALGIPAAIGIPLMGVFVASFANTTLDTSCRLQRYIIQELGYALSPAGHRLESLSRWNPFDWLRNRHIAGVVAIVIAGIVAAIPRPGFEWSMDEIGRGGLILWPLFGATNQLLAGLAFLVIAFFLMRLGRPIWFLVLPLLFMLIVPAWALSLQLFVGMGESPGWIASGNWLLVAIAGGTLLLEVWIVIEALFLWPKLEREIADDLLLASQPPN